MDIQISSNFERLLFELYGRDSNSIERAMSGLSQSGAFTIDEEPLAQLRAEFSAGRCSETETSDTIRQTLADSDYLLDPHTAVAVHVAKDHHSKGPMIVLSTAHPAKFPTAVKSASGIHPALPEWQKSMMEREEKFTVLENSLEAVEAFISENGRI